MQALADETRAKVETEKKLREEVSRCRLCGGSAGAGVQVESEVQSLGRKIRLLEDSVERQQDRLEVTNRNLAAATETLQSSDGGRWEHGEAKHFCTRVSFVDINATKFHKLTADGYLNYKCYRADAAVCACSSLDVHLSSSYTKCK